MNTECKYVLNKSMYMQLNIEQYGGNKHIDNLITLCRECHGKKTTMENL